MTDSRRSPRTPRVLFICGSINQTTQLHQVARELAECDARFTPYYANTFENVLTGFGLTERTIMGAPLRARCLAYLSEQGLKVDFEGRRGDYDLVVTSSDVVIPKNIRGIPLLAVQEGILDPEGLMSWLVRRSRGLLPLWLAGTSATGMSGAYQRFCVASPGYKDFFVRHGAPADRVVVTGIPNFDDCEALRQNDFPHRGYVLVCTSDARETLKFDRRGRFLARAREIARGRPLIFKLHPNEDVARATREIKQLVPEALVFAEGPTGEMIANCDALVTQYSSTVFVGLALGKEVHSYYPLDELRRLMPIQNRSAARNIAAVCRDVLAGARTSAPALAPSLLSGVLP